MNFFGEYLFNIIGDIMVGNEWWHCYFSYAWTAISNVLDGFLHVATHLGPPKASPGQIQMGLFLICVVVCIVKWTMGEEMEDASLKLSSDP